MIRFTASFSPRKLRYRNRTGNSCLSAVNLFCDSQIWKSFLPTMRNYGESATTMELPAIFINCATFPISWNTVASKPSQVSINAPYPRWLRSSKTATENGESPTKPQRGKNDAILQNTPIARIRPIRRTSYAMLRWSTDIPEQPWSRD